MPRRRDERARVLGPTWCKDKASWRATVLQPQADESGHRRTYRYFGDKNEAQDWIEETRAKLVRLSGVTIEQALTEYREHLRERDNKEESDDEKLRRLGKFFESVKRMQVSRLRPERGAELYASFRDGRSVDYHRDSLSAAKGFLSWCINRGWITESPLAKVNGIAKKNKGKLQFTGDECKRWLALCMAKAARRDSASAVRHSDAAIALMMLLLMALRQSDVLRRTVRDVDLDATVLRVSNGKTKKSNRPRWIPVQLRPFLKTITAGLPSSELLFGERTISWLIKAQRRFCKEAGVPYVCPHGLKGTAGSVLAVTGELSDKIADHLSHDNSAITERHYIAPGILDGVQASRALEVLFPVPKPVPEGSTNVTDRERN
jgi:integrase